MKLYLAGLSPHKKYIEDMVSKLSNRGNFYILESFFSVKEWLFDYVDKDNFLLDSGAFSMFGGHQKKDLDTYIDEYIDFINKHDLKYFFELDIYSIVGIKKTEQIRDYIEKKTRKKTIPVWHMMLGTEYYKMLCENYNYIAIGASGKHDSKWTRRTPEKLKSLVDSANSKNVKVHGLGYRYSFEQWVKYQNYIDTI